MEDKIEVLIPEEDIHERIKEMADVLSEKYRGEKVVLVGILTGGIFFLTELARNMSIPVEIDFMAASSYGDATESSGKVLLKKDLDRNVAGKHVIIAEDIVDTGRTMHLLVKLVKQKEPASVEVAVLLDKPSRRKIGAEVDYVGFRIPEEFVVGFGLDYEQKYRELPFIGIVKK